MTNAKRFWISVAVGVYLGLLYYGLTGRFAGF
jgi:hypothetical protein